jgi:hypothetical protein
MGRVSTRSNPTNLQKIDKGRISILVSEIAGRRYFNVIKLDLSGLKLAEDDRVICVARTGKSSRRFEMGRVASWQKENLPLDDLDRSESLRFRILIHPENDPQLKASAENLRPLDESQSESLLPMEPADLGQLLWRLDINEDGPVLKFNMNVFPSAAGIENYLPFGALVLPEALRKVMQVIANDAEQLNDEMETLSPWGPWLDALGVNRPSDDAEDEEKETWCNEVVAVFCSKHLFASRLGHQLESGGVGND